MRVAKARTSHTDSVRESAMEGANNRSSDASREKVREDSEPSEKGEVENRDEKAEKIDEQRRVSSDSSTDYTLGNSSRGESKASQLQTLASAKLLASDSRVEFDDSSDHLSGSVYLCVFFRCHTCSCLVVNGILLLVWHS